MAIKAKINESTMPINNVKTCEDSMMSLIFQNLYKVAALNTGTAMKKENSAAAALSYFSTCAAIIVEPDLETPGIKAKH